ncbi:MAG: DUF262 domain-containing protein [Proteobacteria bacterium]|nr:DUF262 domain-containing protein [Pseudomonadota bacterium]
MSFRSHSVMSLLNMIHTDRNLVLPDVQREFVWSRDQIRLLMDSVMRGYPFGSLLLWETRFLEVDYREFVKDYTPHQRFTPSTKKAGKSLLMVLDGQQRLQSLYIAVHGTHEKRRLYFNVTSGGEVEGGDDPSEGLGTAYRFEFWRSDEPNRPKRLVAVSETLSWAPRFEDDEIDKVIDEIGLEGDERRVAAKNMRHLRRVFSQSDLVPLEIIDDQATTESQARTLDEILDIFVRVNTGGTRLSRSDLMFSLIKRHWGGARIAFDELVDEIEGKMALGIDKDFVIRGLLTVAGAPPSYKIENIRNYWQKMAEVFDGFADALRASIDFCTAPDVGIISRSLLKPEATLFPVIYYIYHQPGRAVPDGERIPLRAFVYFLLFNNFLRYPEARIRYLRSELAPAKGGKLPLERLLGVIERHQKWVNVETSVQMLNENQRLALSLAQRNVAKETLSWHNLPEVDHIFPQSTYAAKYPDLVHDIGNLAYLGKLRNIRKSKQPPWEYFADVPDRELEDDFLIRRDLLGPDMFEEFVKDRRERLVNRVRELLGR